MLYTADVISIASYQIHIPIWSDLQLLFLGRSRTGRINKKIVFFPYGGKKKVKKKAKLVGFIINCPIKVL